MAPFAGLASRRAASRLTCGVLLLAHTAGCTAWRPVPGALVPQQSQTVDHALVELRNGQRIVLDDVVVRPDSVSGYLREAHARVAFEHGEVVQIEHREFQWLPTFGVVVVSLVAAYVVAVIAALAALEHANATAGPTPSVP